MKAATTRRPFLPAWARALRAKCTRQRCQEAMEQLGDGRLEAIVGVGNDQFDATETALPELAQEGGPEGFCLRVADVQAQHLARGRRC